MLFLTSLGQWCKRLKSKDQYCGFICSIAREKVQEVLDEVVDFSKYNPETAVEVLERIEEMVNETKPKVSTGA